VLISSSSAALVASLLLLVTRDMLPNNYFPALSIELFCIPVMTLLRLHDKIAHAFSWFALAFAPSMAIRPCLFLLLIFLTWLGGSTLTADRTMLLQLVAVLTIMLVQYFVMRPRLCSVLNAKP
jgi:hypothetical protein